MGKCDFIEEEISRDKSLKIIDIGCGTGRHAIELTKRGYNVTGVDLSGSQIKMPNRKSNIFDKIPADIPDEIFETIIESKTFKIERIVSLGQKTQDGTWLSQDRDEWVLVLKGKAQIRFEDDKEILSMQEGDYLHIPSGQRHRVEWTDPGQKTIWLAIHYDK